MKSIIFLTTLYLIIVISICTHFLHKSYKFLGMWGEAPDSGVIIELKRSLNDWSKLEIYDAGIDYNGYCTCSGLTLTCFNRDHTTTVYTLSNNQLVGSNGKMLNHFIK